MAVAIIYLIYFAVLLVGAAIGLLINLAVAAGLGILVWYMGTKNDNNGLGLIGAIVTACASFFGGWIVGAIATIIFILVLKK